MPQSVFAIWMRNVTSAEASPSAARARTETNPSASRAVTCDPALAGQLAQSIEALGYPALALPSGAGHDGVIMSKLTAIAMLFVRCKGGISHNPAESVATADVAVAIDVLARFLELLAQS